MEYMDSHPGGRDEGLPDVVPGPVDASKHWLSDLLRADVIGLAAGTLTVAAMFGLPMLNTALLGFFPYDPMQERHWIRFLVPAAAGLAVILGLFALRQAGKQASPTWVRALSGSAVLVSTLFAVATVVAALYAPEPADIFGPIGP